MKMENVNVNEVLKMNLQLLASESEADENIEKDEHSQNQNEIEKDEKLQEKMFTQDQVNDLINKRFAKLKKQEETRKQQEAEAKKLENMSAAERTQKLIKDMEDKIAKMEADKSREALVSSTLKEMATRGIDASFLDFVIGADADTTKEKLDIFQNKFDSIVNAKVETQINERLKTSGGTPRTGTIQKQGDFTLEDIKKMTPAEVNANWEKISKMKFN